MSAAAKRPRPRPERRVGSEPDLDRVVTQREAAELAGCSKDTIVRARAAGRFPNARLDGHSWTVPIDDLIAAGLYDPVDRQPDCPGPRPAAESQRPAGIELARAQARIAALEDLVARQDEELRFLRQLAVDTLGSRTARS